MRKRYRLTESRLRCLIREAVKSILNEAGDSKRGQWMLGRLRNRQSNGGGKFSRSSLSYNDAGEVAYNANGGNYSDDYHQGYDDEEKYGFDRNLGWDSKKYKNLDFIYRTKEMEDMEELGREFINFIENHNGGELLQTIVDYESGNQTGEPQSPLDEIIPYFEEEVLGYECTTKMKKAIKSAYNQWWYYAQDQLMSDE